MNAEVAVETSQSSNNGAPSGEAMPAIEIAEEDAMRAQIYGLLARVLAMPMSDETLEIVRGLDDIQSESDISKALRGFGELTRRTPRVAAEEEYSTLFYGMGSGGELHPYASYYLTGFIYEKPLADLRRDLTELGIETARLNEEPEDHIAFLMEIMHGLITGRFTGDAGLEQQKSFFAAHIAPWAGPFFRDLEKAENAKIYMPVGTLGKVFMELEADAFEMIAT